MRVSVKSTSDLGRRMTIAVPADEVERAISERLKRVARNARIAGFRPGKAPLKVIEAKFGNDVHLEVTGELIQNSLRDALGQEGLHPAGSPGIEPKTLGRGQDLEYIANFEIFPEVKKTDLVGRKIERPKAEITDKDIDRTIENMRHQRTSWSEVDRASKGQDRVIIDFEGKVGGEAFEGGQASDFPVILGSGTMLKDFEDQLFGVKPGEDKTFSLTFPKDYQGREVAGKSAEFKIKVLELGEPKLPEVDAEFVKSFGVESGDVDKMRQDVQENMQRELDNRTSLRLREQVMQALLETNEIEVPHALVEEEIDRMIESNHKTLVQQGVKLDQKQEIDRSVFQQEAKRRTAMGLIVFEVIQANKLTPDADRVRQRVELLAASYEDPQTFVQWYYSDKARLKQIESLVLEEQMVDLLVEGADVVDKTVSFEDFMKPHSAHSHGATPD